MPIFPLFVPKSLFRSGGKKNAEGFAKECAIVTHYRLKADPSQKGNHGGSRSQTRRRTGDPSHQWGYYLGYLQNMDTELSWPSYTGESMG